MKWKHLNWSALWKVTWDEVPFYILAAYLLLHDWRPDSLRVTMSIGGKAFYDRMVPWGTVLYTVTCSNGPLTSVDAGWQSVALYPPVLVTNSQYIGGPPKKIKKFNLP